MMRSFLRALARYTDQWLASWAYSFQTFSIGEVLAASKMDQIEVNIRDHQHGLSSVSVLTRESNAGLVLLASGTVAAAASLSLVLTGYTAYRGLLLVLAGFQPVTDDVQLLLRVSTDGGSTYDTTGYITNGVAAAAYTTTSGFVVAGSASGGAGEQVGNAAVEHADAVVTILNQISTAFQPLVEIEGCYLNTTTGLTVISNRGVRSAAQDTDAVRVLFSSGNIDEGVYALYGIN